MRNIDPGDILLCYVTQLSRWIGVLEATSQIYEDDTRIWQDDIYPFRVMVKPVITLDFETALPVQEFIDQLKLFQRLPHPEKYWLAVRNSPKQLLDSDGELLTTALHEAAANPVRHAFDSSLLDKPSAFEVQRLRRRITVPQEIEDTTEPEAAEVVDIREAASDSRHSEIQSLLLKLGSDLGLNVWVARNDQNKEVDGQRLADIQNCLSRMPVQFDEPTRRIIEHIDVLWLRGNSILAAFEIEATTSVYSGLLRMSDLSAMHPNLNIDLYVVAAQKRRRKVIHEVNRPTFARLVPPLGDSVRFLSFERLQDEVDRFGARVSHLKHVFIRDIAETCAIEE